MISFQTNDKNLTDINIHYPNNTLSKAISGQYDTLENKSIVAKEILSGFPLCPMVQKIDTNDRFARNISVSNYTSYVFLNNDIMSKNGNNSITFTLRLLISEGRSSSQFGKTYTIEVLKNVQDERGWIPVEVRYASVYPRET